jgi:hypothetical protein
LGRGDGDASIGMNWMLAKMVASPIARLVDL